SHRSNQNLIEARQSVFKRFWRRMLRGLKQHPLQQHQANISANGDEDEIDKVAAERSTRVALQAVGQSLSDAGFELGKDFSYAQGSLILNDLALAHLRQKLGPNQFDYITQRVPDLFQAHHQTAIQALEKHLGVPFFENLKQVMVCRLPTLTDAEIISYFTRLANGLGHRHPEIKGLDGWVRAVVHEAIAPERLQDISERYRQGRLKFGPDDGWMLLIDLLTAADGVEGVHFQTTDEGYTDECIEITSKGLQLLDQLITGVDSRFVDQM
ncbi:MAG: hypothetical protein AAGC54_16135, partial [Cyanobacteria bacterium P01_F01_bin.4]